MHKNVSKFRSGFLVLIVLGLTLSYGNEAFGASAVRGGSESCSLVLPGNFEGVRDVAIYNIVVPGKPKLGEEAKVKTTIKNCGGDGTINVTLEEDGTFIDGTTVDIKMRQAKSIWFSWMPENSGEVTLNVTVDLVGDANPADNSIEISVTVK